MSYRCNLCHRTVPPGNPKRRHAVTRSNGQIEREYDVCHGCSLLLGRGFTVSQVAAERLVPPPPDPLAVPPPLVLPPAPVVHQVFAPPLRQPLAAKVLDRWQRRANSDLNTSTSPPIPTPNADTNGTAKE